MRIGRWKRTYVGLTSADAPCYECGKCGGSPHFYGDGYPKRKLLCDICGRVNIYPGEKAWEVSSSLWEEDEPTEYHFAEVGKKEG